MDETIKPSNMTRVIGVNYRSDFIELFLRSESGYKFRIPVYSGEVGYARAKDFYMSSGVQQMTFEEYRMLPEQEKFEKIEPDPDWVEVYSVLRKDLNMTDAIQELALRIKKYYKAK